MALPFLKELRFCHLLNYHKSDSYVYVIISLVIAGVCGELKTDAELFKDGSLGSMKSPDNLNIKSNGDILFTDDTMCLRTLKKGALRTLLGEQSLCLDSSWQWKFRVS